MHTNTQGLLWFTVTVFAIGLLLAIFMCFSCYCCKNRDRSSIVGRHLFYQQIVGYFSRIGWIITLLVMHTRIHKQWVAATVNTNVINNQTANFQQFAT